MKQDAQAREKEIGKIGSQVPGGLELYWKGQLATPDSGKQFFTGLNGAFGPTMLLRLETIHIDR